MYSVVCNVRIYCLDTVYCRQYTIHATLIHLAYHDDETPVYDVIEIEGCNSNFRREDLSQGHSLLMHYDRYTMIALVSSKHLPCLFLYCVYRVYSVYVYIIFIFNSVYSVVCYVRIYCAYLLYAYYILHTYVLNTV